MSQIVFKTGFYFSIAALLIGCQSKDDASNSRKPQQGQDTSEIADAAKEPQDHESTNPNSNMVDLSLYTKSLNDYLKGSIARFAAKHPDVEVSCIAFYFTTYGSSVFINYETKSHSDALVEKFQGKDDSQDTIGEDAKGSFTKQPLDFEYAQQDQFVFEGLPNFYEVKWPLKFRRVDGKVQEIDSEDDLVGQMLLESFEPALKSFNEFGDLKRSDDFRMGLTIHGTTCEAFWLQEPKQ